MRQVVRSMTSWSFLWIQACAAAGRSEDDKNPDLIMSRCDSFRCTRALGRGGGGVSWLLGSRLIMYSVELSVQQAALNRPTQQHWLCSTETMWGRGGGQAARLWGEVGMEMERIPCERERVRKRENTNDPWVCSIFSLFLWSSANTGSAYAPPPPNSLPPDVVEQPSWKGTEKKSETEKMCSGHEMLAISPPPLPSLLQLSEVL